VCRDAWVPASGAEGALVGSPETVELSRAIEAVATRCGPGVAFQFHAGCGDESLPVQTLTEHGMKLEGRLVGRAG